MLLAMCYLQSLYKTAIERCSAAIGLESSHCNHGDQDFHGVVSLATSVLSTRTFTSEVSRGFPGQSEVRMKAANPAAPLAAVVGVLPNLALNLTSSCITSEDAEQDVLSDVVKAVEEAA